MTDYCPLRIAGAARGRPVWLMGRHFQHKSTLFFRQVCVRALHVWRVLGHRCPLLMLQLLQHPNRLSIANKVRKLCVSLLRHTLPMGMLCQYVSSVFLNNHHRADRLDIAVLTSSLGFQATMESSSACLFLVTFRAILPPRLFTARPGGARLLPGPTVDSTLLPGSTRKRK